MDIISSSDTNLLHKKIFDHKEKLQEYKIVFSSEDYNPNKTLLKMKLESIILGHFTTFKIS